MNEKTSSDNVASPYYHRTMSITYERRAKPRIDCDYPAIFEGQDTNGERFTDNARLTNLSASGLYMLTNRPIENGSKLSITVLISNLCLETSAPKLITNGKVVRTEFQKNGSYGIAVKFNNHRFQ